jgi:hypothetical protein
VRPLNRIVSALPPQAFKTYQITRPASTHRRTATCDEAGCLPYRQGWTTAILRVNDPQGQLEHTVRKSGRRFTEERIDGGVRFSFPAGQPCFRAATHTVPLEREPLYLVRGGDWRGNPLRVEPYRHTKGEFWVEDFAEHQARLAREIEKG